MRWEGDGALEFRLGPGSHVTAPVINVALIYGGSFPEGFRSPFDSVAFGGNQPLSSLDGGVIGGGRVIPSSRRGESWSSVTVRRVGYNGPTRESVGSRERDHALIG